MHPICLSISKVPLNAEINHCHHEGCHGESLAPDSRFGEVSEEVEVLFIVETQKGDGDGQQSEAGTGQKGQQVDPGLIGEWIHFSEGAGAIAALPSDYPSTAWHPWRSGSFKSLGAGEKAQGNGRQAQGAGGAKAISSFFLLLFSFFPLSSPTPILCQDIKALPLTSYV